MSRKTTAVASAAATPDARVRAAAAEMQAAIAEARRAGYVVEVPFDERGLTRIAISETKAVAAADVPATDTEVPDAEPADGTGA